MVSRTKQMNLAVPPGTVSAGRGPFRGALRRGPDLTKHSHPRARGSGLWERCGGCRVRAGRQEMSAWAGVQEKVAGAGTAARRGGANGTLAVPRRRQRSASALSAGSLPGLLGEVAESRPGAEKVPNAQGTCCRVRAETAQTLRPPRLCQRDPGGPSSGSRRRPNNRSVSDSRLQPRKEAGGAQPRAVGSRGN